VYQTAGLFISQDRQLEKRKAVKTAQFFERKWLAFYSSYIFILCNPPRSLERNASKRKEISEPILSSIFSLLAGAGPSL